MSSRAAVRRLRAGIVPPDDLESLSVGYGSITSLVKCRLAALSENSPAEALFVTGEWGSGKSHLLSFVRAAAGARSIPVSSIDLNARSAALNYPQRLYPIIAENLQAGGASIGLRGIVLNWLNDCELRARLAQAAKSLSEWQLSWAIASLIARHEDGENVALEDSGDWSLLLGSDLRWANYGYKRDQALARLGALAALFHRMGIGGLALVFDEAETVDQLWNVRSRLTAYGVLGRFCKMTSVWCVYGITKRFNRTIAYDVGGGFASSLPAAPDAQWFLESWSDGFFDTVEPPEVDARQARVLARNVARVYDAAYGADRLRAGLADECVNTWLQNPGRNPRRLIRLLVHHMDLGRPI